MIDLAKLTLKEVQELVESTVDGRAVRIYANDGLPEMDGNLKLKPKTIDFTNLPVDTLVGSRGTLLRIAQPPVYPNSVRLFRHGGDSLTTVGDSMNVSCNEITLVEGRKVVWEGGECPLPEGVEVRTKCRGAGSLILKHNCSKLVWLHEGSDSDIIWYQITGRIV